MTRYGRISTNMRVWDCKPTRNISRLFVKLQEDKSELELNKESFRETCEFLTAIIIIYLLYLFVFTIINRDLKKL